MFLPEVLRKWAMHQAKGRREPLNKAVMIVFPTQFGCQKIRDSLVDYREHPYWNGALRTGADKEVRFSVQDTYYQVVTYGMLWHWLVNGGEETQRILLHQNCAFLLDEFSGKAAGGDPMELAADPQVVEIARLLARLVQRHSTTHRLMVAGASLEEEFMSAVLPGADFLALTGRIYLRERCIFDPRDVDEILTLCARCRGRRSTARSSAIHPVPLRAPPSDQVPQEQHVTLTLTPPSRLPYIDATMQQLQDKGFPKILWLPVPDPVELECFLERTRPPQRRVMALWRTIVLLAVLQVCVTYDCTGAMVVGDTVVLQPHVTYEIVAREVHEKNAAAGMLRYGNRFAGIEEWVMDCREELGRTFRRRDDVRSKLKLKLSAAKYRAATHGV